MTTSYNFANVLSGKEFRQAVEALHRDYYDLWRRTPDVRERELIAARADALDDVVAVLQMLSNRTGDSDA